MHVFSSSMGHFIVNDPISISLVIVSLYLPLFSSLRFTKVWLGYIRRVLCRHRPSAANAQAAHWWMREIESQSRRHQIHTRLLERAAHEFAERMENHSDWKGAWDSKGTVLGKSQLSVRSRWDFKELAQLQRLWRQDDDDLRLPIKLGKMPFEWMILSKTASLTME